MNPTMTSYYYDRINVDPGDDNRIWMPVFDLMVSTDGGKTLVKANMKHVHNDQHGIWINPNDPQHIDHRRRRRRKHFIQPRRDLATSWSCRLGSFTKWRLTIRILTTSMAACRTPATGWTQSDLRQRRHHQSRLDQTSVQRRRHVDPRRSRDPNVDLHGAGVWKFLAAGSAHLGPQGTAAGSG